MTRQSAAVLTSRKFGLQQGKVARIATRPRPPKHPLRSARQPGDGVGTRNVFKRSTPKTPAAGVEQGTLAKEERGSVGKKGGVPLPRHRHCGTEMPTGRQVEGWRRG